VTSTSLSQLLADIKSGLSDIYGDRLRGVYLYGSYARGEQGPDSDIDILIVLDEITNYYAELNRTGELISNLSLECGVSISRVFTTINKWSASTGLFLRNVRNEAMVV
jgi:predicted nucleotidyltransferase